MKHGFHPGPYERTLTGICSFCLQAKRSCHAARKRRSHPSKLTLLTHKAPPPRSYSLNADAFQTHALHACRRLSLGDGGPSLSVSAPCPTALSFGDSGEIISRVMTLITTEHPVPVQPRGCSAPCSERVKKEGKRERRGASQEEFNSAEPTGEDERSLWMQ